MWTGARLTRSATPAALCAVVAGVLTSGCSACGDKKCPGGPGPASSSVPAIHAETTIDGRPVPTSEPTTIAVGHPITVSTAITVPGAVHMVIRVSMSVKASGRPDSAAHRLANVDALERGQSLTATFTPTASLVASRHLVVFAQFVDLSVPGGEEDSVPLVELTLTTSN